MISIGDNFIYKKQEFCTSDKLIYKQCIGKIATKTSWNQIATKHGDIYRICNYELQQFVDNTLPKIKYYFTLIYSQNADIINQ